WQIVTSQRGKRVLLRAGHRYHEKRRNKDGSCKKCKAKLIIANNNTITRDDKHDCEPDFASNELEIQFNKCCEQIKSDYTISIPRAYRETVAGPVDSGIDFIKKIPTLENIKHKLHRKRNKSLGVQKICFNSIKEIIVPERYQHFLLADYSNGPSRIIIFANRDCKKILTNPNLTILCDGTFKFCLKHNDTYNNIIPIIYALLPNKNKNTYITMFKLIKSQIPQFSPQLFILDFEQAAMSAIKHVFPKTKINGCYFHFAQSLWRKADELNITTSKLARKHVKRCTVMAHLPREAIDNAWLYIMAQCPTNKNVVLFNNYFVQTWLNDKSFFADKWCSNHLHRTTNMIENWHSILNKKISSKPKNIAHFLTILEKENNYYEVLYTNGTSIRKKLPETQEIDQHISQTIEEFITGDINIDLCIERLVL
ncbi:hypothetical protein HW555_013339, partial [Spodoptera exigua]